MRSTATTQPVLPHQVEQQPEPAYGLLLENDAKRRDARREARAPEVHAACKVALVDVFVAHREQLRTIALKIVGTADLADDVVQEAYLKLAHAPSPGDVHKPLCYCCQIVRNAAVDLRRRYTVESSYRTYTEDGEAPQVPGGASPDEGLDERRVLDAIDKALDAVPARTRRAFELHRLCGLTQREIGRRLGCSATLVNFMVRDAGNALASCRALRNARDASVGSIEPLPRTPKQIGSYPRPSSERRDFPGMNRL